MRTFNIRCILSFMLCTTFALNAEFYAESINDIKVPKNFIWGTALSEYQVSGAAYCRNSNWSDFETTLPERSDDACQFWQRYKDDITLMKQMGVQSLRFSVEWCKIEPQEGKFDAAALQHYVDMCDALLEANITPMITLHHFVHPSWFEQKGGFTDPANIHYFERYCAYVFEHFSDKVHLWCTINEPTIFTFQGYARGVFPPGRTNLISAWHVLRNMIHAHTRVYHKLKGMKNGKDAQIGLVHQYLKFHSYTSWNPLEMMPGLLFNSLLNDSVMEFLKTGEFNGWFGVHYNAHTTKNNDFIGLNYYSRATIKASLDLSNPVDAAHYPDEIMTDMPYAIYPQGFYDALMDLKELQIPIYVTENGIADAKDDRRDLYIRSYLAAMDKAIADGADVRGYYYWSIMDNFEWDMGYGKKFGLIEVDRQTQERKLRTGAKFYVSVLQKALANSNLI